MTDSIETPTDHPAGDAVSAPPVVTAADLRAVAFEAAIPDATNVDVFSLCAPYYRLAEAAGASGDERAHRVYRLLNGLCTYSLNIEDRAGPFRPLFEMGNQRGMIPDDCRGAQSEALLPILDQIRHPGLRARIADTVWTNHRRYGQAAAVAVDAYADCVEGLLDGRFHHEHEYKLKVAFETLKLLQRALQIADATNKNGAIPDRLTANLKRIIESAEAAGELVTFRRASETGLSTGLIEPLTVATSTEAIVAKAPDSTDSHLLKSMWKLAADAYRRAGKEDDSRRCNLAGAEELVRLADKRKASATVAAMFLMDAIGELRRIKGTKARRKELEAQLRELQEDSLDEMGSFAVPMDLSDIAAVVLKHFETMTLPQMLLQLAAFVHPKKVEDLKAAARASAEQSPLSSMFGETRLDGGGKVISRNSGFELRGEPTDEWFRHRIARDEGLRREITIHGQIEPARLSILHRYPLSERHFHPIVQLSPFVPPGYEHIFALGFARLFQGDNISAVHLLIPQLENSIRYVLKAHGKDASMIQADMVQEDRSLSALLADERPTLEAIFGADWVFEVDLLFNDRAGPALRHEMAHGKLTSGYCYSPNAIYAAWLIYRVTVLPLSQDWDAIVVPHFEREVL